MAPGARVARLYVRMQSPLAPESQRLDAEGAHVEIVTLAKLRRNESFALVIPDEVGGRISLWISPVSTLQFRIVDVRQEIDREWLDQLIEGANSPGGLRVEQKAAT